ncbi:glycosyltransferase family 32 protein [Segatella copri]|uniref:glycosyltransferase family 32 protein n=1 Tax=Segatella copri TaxID=165179 RepID=UPI00222FEBD4|nr:glycosyltransferase [Segatella copri]MCW4103857.1 glycosyltransferase [Segatella copri]
MNIPNKIHYCWYGGGKMNHILRLCVKSFSHLGENEIKCWNEENSDIYEHEAIRFLVEKKDWAFVSDYVRLKVLYEHGGIYFDTDIRVSSSMFSFLIMF